MTIRDRNVASSAKLDFDKVDIFSGTKFRLVDDFIDFADGLDWGLVAPDSGGATLQTAHGGVVNLDASDATIADNDEVYINSVAKIVKPDATKAVTVEARLKFAEAATNAANVIFGLSSVGGADLLVNNGGGPPSSYDGMVFYKVDGGTKWNAEVSNATTQNTATDIATRQDNTWTVLRIEYVPSASGTALVKFWLDDGVTKGYVARLNLTISGLDEMYVVAGIKNGSASEEVLSIDYIKVEADR